MQGSRNLRWVALGAERLSLYLALLTIAGLSLYRTLHIWLTGFVVPDEYGYIVNSIIGEVYGGRIFFGGVNITLFRLFEINDVDRQLVFLTFYFFLWGLITVLSAFKLMKVLGANPTTILATFVVVPFVFSYSLLSASFLTEPVSLAMAMVATYLLVSALLGARWRLWRLLGSGLAFAAAVYAREPYVVYLLGWSAIFLYIVYRGRYFQGSNTLSKLSLVVAFFIGLVLAEYPGGYLSKALGLFQFYFQQKFGGSFSTPISNGAVAPSPYIAVWIFFESLIIGWGPILATFLFCSFAYLIAKRKETRHFWVALAIGGLAVLSLAAVSVIFSNDPGYTTASQYSTLIRFSDTVLPGFFVLCPPLLAKMMTRKKLFAGFLVLLVATTVALYPVLFQFSESNLHIKSPTMFSLSHREFIAEVRDFVVRNPAFAEQPFVISPPGGKPYHPATDPIYGSLSFAFTPQSVRNTTFVPYQDYSSFAALKWGSFCMLITSQILKIANSNSSFAYIQVLDGSSNTNYPFAVSNSTTVYDDAFGKLICVTLDWGK